MPYIPQQSTSGARATASRALERIADIFPDITPQPLPVGDLSALDGKLALAIYRTALQRWLTLEYLLDGRLNKPIDRMEPAMRGVLMCAAAQLVFMDRLPAHAVVHEAVSLARRMVRPAAAGMANAVLRRIAEVVTGRVDNQPWSPAPDRLPLETGYVQLATPELPPVSLLAEHLGAATSHSEYLVQRWIDSHGSDAATTIAQHGVSDPPTIVIVEPGFDIATCTHIRPHVQPNCVIWDGPHAAMVAFLAEHQHRRVQDPTATLPGIATTSLTPRVIVDLCAGRGTKTRHLAALHPNARIIATDTDGNRLSDLRRACRGYANVEVVMSPQLEETVGNDGVDLMLLDVPCSNTGVLGRRPEARYRFGPDTLRALVAIQRRIADRAMAMMNAEGHILFSTCSIEPEENQAQTQWLLARAKASLVEEHQTLPGGFNADAHDGGYYALIKRSRA